MSAIVPDTPDRIEHPAAADTALPLTGERTRALTPREREVLEHICDGKSNREIAALLDLSVNTVSVHRANIMGALGVHNAAELVAYALQNGLVNPL